MLDIVLSRSMASFPIGLVGAGHFPCFLALVRVSENFYGRKLYKKLECFPIFRVTLVLVVNDNIYDPYK